MKAVGKRRMSAGFTLIELMIVVAVIAVLAGIAMYNYQAAVVRAKRSAATSCLQSGAQYMERYYTTYMSYNNAGTPPALPQCDSGVASSYTVALAPSADGRSYTITATPINQQAEPIRSVPLSRFSNRASAEKVVLPRLSAIVGDCARFCLAIVQASRASG